MGALLAAQNVPGTLERVVPTMEDVFISLIEAVDRQEEGK